MSKRCEKKSRPCRRNPQSGSRRPSSQGMSLDFNPLEDRRMLATFTVTNITDGAVAAAGDLPGSLRQAIFDANANPGEDTIQFDSGVFTGGTDSLVLLTAGELEITDSLNIDGATGAEVTISAGFDSRVLNFNVAAGDLTLRSINVTEGGAIGYEGAIGGGISTESGSLTLIDSTVSDNRGYLGGGIYTDSGSVTLTNSVVSENLGLLGGGIFTRSGQVTLTNSTVSENEVRGAYFVGGAGGGIHAGDGDLTLLNSTVSGNAALSDNSGGGGIFKIGGSITLVNSTVSNNRSITGGYFGSAGSGGIVASVSEATVINSTITENLSFAFNGDSSAGGISLSGTTVTIQNSIIAGNSSDRAEADFAVIGTNVLIEHTLIGATDQAIVGTNNLIGSIGDPIDPLLGPLSFNGGPTQTHGLRPNSPAVDAGSSTELTDQRGFARPIDSPVTANAAGGNGADIGAVERQTSEPLSDPPVVAAFVRDEGGVLERPDLLSSLAVTFNVDVDIEAGDLVIRDAPAGGAEIDISGSGFSYDAPTRTATWDLSGLSLEPAFYGFTVSDNVRSTASNEILDGDADGIPGGVFTETVYVALPGDANLDGEVDVLNDGFALIANLGTTGGASWAQGDFNDDENVDVLGDAFILVAHLGQSVLPADPVPTFIVSNNLDGPVAAAGDLPGSLRQAIFDANASLGEEAIEFQADSFTGGANNLIRLTDGELEITDSLIIDGSGVGGVTITGDADGNDIVDAANITNASATLSSSGSLLDDNSRVLNFSAMTGDLTIEGLTITGGRAASGGGNGGGIFSSGGTLTLTDSAVVGNVAANGSGGASGLMTGGSGRSGGDGGGIFAEGTNVVLTNSTVAENAAGRGGGGSFGVISGGRGGAGGSGGGLFVADGSLTLISSTVSGNASGNGGAGSYGYFSGGNGASGGDGGGIFADNATVSIYNSTISNNVSGGGGRGGTGNDDSGNPGGAGDGGGIAVFSSTAISIQNSIVANNSIADGTANDLDQAGGTLTINHSLIGVTDGLTISGNVGNLTGTAASPLDPLLGPLSDNGGPTLTHALLPGSPAIDAGENSLAVDQAGATLTTDQRGFDRFFDGLNSGTAIVDIGAFELDAPSNPPSTATARASESLSLAGSVKLDAAFESGDLLEDALF